MKPNVVFYPNWLFIACISLLLMPPLTAQSLSLKQPRQTALAVEILKPSFEGADTDFATFVAYFSLRAPVTDNVDIVAELPFSRIGFDQDFFNNESHTAIGNPYVGLDFHGRESRFSFEVGFRPNAAPDELDDNYVAGLSGLFTDLAERAEAFVEEMTSIQAMANYTYRTAEGLTMTFRAGPAFWFDAGGDADGQTYLLYGVQAAYQEKHFRVGAGISGRYLASSREDAFLDQRTFSQVQLQTDFILGHFSPGLFLRAPLTEEWQNVLNSVFGLRLQFQP